MLRAPVALLRSRAARKYVKPSEMALVRGVPFMDKSFIDKQYGIFARDRRI